MNTMNRRGTAAVLAAMALAVCLGAAACSEEDAPIHGEGAPGIDAVALNQAVLKYMGDNQIAGATVAVTRAGRLVWSKGYGWANESEQIRMQPWHRSRIGSTSKVITAIGLLQILESAAVGDPGSISTGATALAGQLSRKLYGHPGTDVTSPTWPSVTEATVLNDPEVYWEQMRIGVQNAYPETFEAEMATMIEWASQVEIRHLLSHTANYVNAGNTLGPSADYADVNIADLTYSQVHQFRLAGQLEGGEQGDNVKCWLAGANYVPAADADFTGKKYVLPPLLNEPGTEWCYSNHGFGVAGMAIDDLAGPDTTYHQAITQNVLEPLGLFDVVPNNVDISELDAWPHGGSPLDSKKQNLLGTAAGGWSASARDYARIMCGLDRESNNLRLLDPATVTAMETVAFPDVHGTQPLGWDERSTTGRLSKNGASSGGKSRVAKFLPGYFEDSAPDDEINVALMVNDSSDGAAGPGLGLVTSIARTVAEADIAGDYDLFDPSYRCFVPEPEPQEPGVAVEVPTVTEPPPQPPVVNPTPTTPTQGPTIVSSIPTAPPTRTPRTPPTVTIHLPDAGPHTAPNGTATIRFHGTAVDSAGTAIPGTRLRWTAIEEGKPMVLCVGSAFGPPPTTAGGIVNSADCTTFSRRFTNPVPGTGPDITIRLEARDEAGLVGTEEVIIALHTPPVA